MARLLPGTVYTLQVAREAEFGYFLTDGNVDILLHRSEITESIEIGQSIDVFIFHDKQGRLAATMKIPNIQLDQYGWCEVVDVKEDLGVFIHIGTIKDILIHKDDLPKMKSVWPTVGGKLYCTLKLDKRGNLLGKLATENIMSELFVKADRRAFNKNVTGIIYRTLYSGSFMITEEGYRGFIHESQRTIEPRVGSTVTGRIIDVKEDGTVNVSLLKRGHELLDEDSKKIYSYLESRGGSMPYTDKSQPSDIMKRFGMSKAAFKRALGRLMKEGKVYQEEGWTYSKKDQ